MDMTIFWALAVITSIFFLIQVPSIVYVLVRTRCKIEGFGLGQIIGQIISQIMLAIIFIDILVLPENYQKQRLLIV
jgi:hypothetical protein